MIEPVVIKFAAAGVPEVRAAFAQVGAQVKRLEEQATRDRERGSRARGQATRGEAKVAEQALQKVQKDAEKAERQRTRDAEREAKRRDGIVRRSSTMAGQEASKAARIEAREAERTAREVERLEERKMRIRIRSSEMAGRAAAKEAAEEVRAAERSARARGHAGSRIGGIMTGSVGRLASGVGSIAGATLGIGGGFALASAARSQLESQRTAALLVNAGTSGGVVPGTMQQALGAASADSKVTGISKEVLLGAALKYSQSARGGDFQGALSNMGMFGKIATVTGADINDVATAAGVLQSQNQALQGKAGQPAMQQMLLNTIAQSHAGSMSMVDAAKQIGTLGSTRSYFTQDEAVSQQQLIGMGQIARVGGDAGEAGTFVKDIAAEVGMANRKWRKKHGGKDLVKVDEHGRMESPEQLVADVFRGTKGNIGEIGELFGKRGSTFFRELEKSYIAGEKTGGVEGGVKAALGNMREVTGSTMSVAQLNQQFEQSQSTPAAKFQLALNKLSETLEEKLEPHMEHFANDTLPKLIPKFEKIIDEADKFASWFADNPIKGVGAVVLAAISKDLLAAGIGTAVKATLSAILRSSGIGGSTPVPGVKPTGALAAVSGLAAGAALAAPGVVATLGGAAEGRLGGQNKVAQLEAGIRAGTIGPAQLAEVERQAREGTSRSKMAAAGVTSALNIDTAAQALGIVDKGKGVFGGADAATRQRELKENEEVIASLGRLKKALNDAATSAGAVPPIKSGAPAVPIPQRPNH